MQFKLSLFIVGKQYLRGEVYIYIYIYTVYTWKYIYMYYIYTSNNIVTYSHRVSDGNPRFFRNWFQEATRVLTEELSATMKTFRSFFDGCRLL